MPAKQEIFCLIVWQPVPSIAHFSQHGLAIFPVPVLQDESFWAYNCHLWLTNFGGKKNCFINSYFKNQC